MRRTLTAALLVLVVSVPAFGQPATAAPLVSTHPVRLAQPEANAAQFHIFGHVEAPGSYRWFRAMTVKRAIERADGYTSRGSKEDLEIQRVIDGKLTTFAVKEDDPVQADDVIMVREAAIDPGAALPTEGNNPPRDVLARPSPSM